MDELTDYKSKARETEQKLTAEYSQNLLSLRDEIAAASSNFQSRLALFEDYQKDVEMKNFTAQKSAEAMVTALTVKHDAELAEIVRYHNEKYHDMLVEQLAIQNSLKQRSADDLAANLDSAYGQTQAKLSELKAAHEQHMASTVDAMNNLLEDQLKRQRTELMADLEKLHSELQTNTDHNHRLTIELQDSYAAIHTLQELKEYHLSEIEKMSSLTDDLKRDLDKSISDVDVLQLQQRNYLDDVARLQSMLLTHSEKTNDTEANYVRKCQECDNLSFSLMATKTELAALLSTTRLCSVADEEVEALRLRLTSSERDAESLRAEVNTMGAALAAAREELKTTQRNAQKSTQDLERWVAASSMDKEAVMGKFKEASALAISLSNELSELRAKSDAMNDQIATERAQAKVQLIQMAQSHDRILAENGANHSEVVGNFANRVKFLENEMSTKMRTLQEAHEAKMEDYRTSNDLKMKEIHDSNRKSAEETKKEHVKVLQRQNGQHDADISDLQNVIEQLNIKLQSTSDAAETEKILLRNDLQRAETKVSLLTKELDLKRLENERAESVQSSLKSQIESLREELQASQVIFAKKLESALLRRDEDWTLRLAEHSEFSSCENDKVLREAQHIHAWALQDLRDSHAEHIIGLKNKISSLEEEIEAVKFAFRKEGDAVRAQWSQEVADMSATHSTLAAEHEEEMNFLRKSHAQFLNKLEVSNATEVEERLRRTHLENEETLTKLRAQCVQDVADVQAACIANVQVLQRQHEIALTAVTVNSADELLAKLDEQRVLFEGQQECDRAAHREDMSKQVEITLNLESKCSELNHDLLTMQNQLESERKNAVYVALKFTSELKTTREDLNAVIEKNLSQYKEDVDSLQIQSLTCQQELHAKYDKEVMRLNTALEMQRAEYDRLDGLYQNRESRTEDVVLVLQLESRISQQDAIIVAQNEESQRLKREMLNREETYNQKFCSRPSVGVMHVLKNDVAGAPVPTTTATSTPSTTPPALPAPITKSKLAGQSIAPLPSSKPQYFLPSPGFSSVTGDFSSIGLGDNVNAVEGKKKQSTSSSRGATKTSAL
jgi:hypothetical protein